GIAGASAAWAMAERHRVVVLERESQPGYHTSGRSAALFSETYGNAVVRGLSVASRDFLMGPPAGFAAHALLGPRGAMFPGTRGQEAIVAKLAEEGSRLVASVRALSAAEARERVPVLRADWVTGAVFEPDAMDIDTHAMLQGYLRALRASGGTVKLDAEVGALARDGDGWRLATRVGEIRAAVVVNAGGAWCDAVGRLAGAAPIGLVPKRRTAFLIDPPAGAGSDGWPLVVAADESFYFKPDAGKLLCSPADETPTEPCDAQPEELDVAIAADRIQQAADLPITRISHRWAGLRSFVKDKTPVAGFDDAVPGFFWLAGQGGYGFQTAPGMAMAVAALIDRRPLPPVLVDRGVTAEALSPARPACRQRKPL
ncbi:MAG: FAD-binding oxidoreductase, partial [Alphaproteobacteria bacterium]|nr:FAD-binding oxidoreductase [Alphaproteobacteria bacterium]